MAKKGIYNPLNIADSLSKYSENVISLFSSITI